jgi:hypothetical protein
MDFGMARSFKYAIIRFCPDERRGESVNIGIAIFIDGQIDIRFANSFAKAQALFPNLSFDGLHGFPARINELLSQFRSITEQHSFLREYGPITASELGRFEISSDEQYEPQVQRLLNDFVIPPRAKSTPRAKTGVLKRNVSDTFRLSGLLGRSPEDIDLHKVVPEFPVSLEENLFVDFAYKNGTYRFAEVVDLRVSHNSLTDKFKECCEKAISLDKAKRKFGSDSTRLVLFSVPNDYTPLVDSSLNLLNDYATHLFNADNDEDLAKFHENLVPLPLSI